MTAFVHSDDGRGLDDRGRRSDLMAALRSIPGRIRASEYMSIGQGRRYRALQRHRTRSASRAGFLVVAVAVGFDAIGLMSLDAEGTRVAIALDAAVLLVALAGWWLLPRSLRHHPEAVAWVVMTGVVASTIVTGLAVPHLMIQTVAYLLVLPGLIALVLPWRTIAHLRWLLALGTMSIVYLAGTERLTSDERGVLAIVLFVAVGASIVGHVMLQRAQIHSFAQLQDIRALHRRADADMDELERVHHALELTARVDPLTGAGNRRRLEEDMRGVRAHISRSGMTYGILALDLDHFKAINDRLGHLAGDDVLKRVVESWTGTLRATDAIYRFGGEEFIVILPVATQDGLLAAAERLRSVIFALGIPHPGNPGVDVVTVSIGATLLDASDLGMTDEDWFGRADRALYEAKASGRNRVQCATREVAEPSPTG